jgi:hypothetical protein
MSKYFLYRFYLITVTLLALFAGISQAQVNRPIRPPIGSGTPPVYDAQGRVVPPKPSQSRGSDSLKHRDNTDDSVTIYFRYFDSTRIRNLDSSINDFTRRYPVPAEFVTLGNFGTAAHSLLFSPNLRPGFDPGFHAFDIYRFKIEDTRFFQTTRPFTELGYMLGSQAEQMVNIIHTQNIKPNFNMALQYRLINSPGEFQNQNTSHNSYRISGNYQSRNKRYSAYGVFLSNKFLASENGGIQRDTLLNDNRFTNRFVIPTRLAGDTNPSRNPFSTRVTTGNLYNENVFFLRQQYDFGQSDSLIVNDTTVIRLFYPRVRFQHSFTLSGQQYEFRDFFVGPNKSADYQTYFGKTVADDTLLYKDKYRTITNDFSIISFPEKNNLNQFIKAGAGHEFINATFDSARQSYHNIYLAGEYRNRTRNQKWDLEGIGKLYLTGVNNGDYSVQASLKREISKKLGYLELGFQNVNRSPSFLFRNETTFPTKRGTFNKENITKLSGAINNDTYNFSLSGEYYLVSNYMYFDSFFALAQTGTLFNILHISGKKQIKLTRVLNLFSEVHFQQAIGNPPLNLPLFYTNNRISFDGVYYKNMNYSIGLELRYHTPYKAPDYSPFIGQFFYQNRVTISNRPQLNAFFNFRIKRFSAFIRVENLNTFGTNTGAPGFTKNNYNAPYYPEKGFWFRLGIWWTFIN